MLLRCSFILCAVLFSILCSKVNSGYSPIDVSKHRADPNPVDEDWWKNGVFYQVYPRSFKEDGRTKGIGNLKGITGQLKHLKDTGITAIWLSQIYMTPDTEHGEDILDFKDIHADYGTLADFDDLIVEAKKQKIKVILDFVLNHSGKKHPWFIQSEAQNAEFKDFYVWRNGTNGKDQPPNNWLSVHGDSAWEWSDKRNEFYLHQFSIDQPDLNYANPKVIEKIMDVMKFWLDRNIDGFRLDAVPFLLEDDQFRNEPPSNNPNTAAYEHESLSHIYTMDQEKTFELIYQLREFIDQYSAGKQDTARILMSEAYTSIANTMRYYGTTEKKGVHIPFNFQLINHNKDSNAIQMVASINEWLSKMPKEQIANWVIGNHDKHRAATRFGPELVDNMNILIASLPGVVVTYNGEEIGQENGNVSFIRCKDPIGCRAGPAYFHNVSRDFERTPYQWDNTDYAGFTGSGATDTWLPVSEKYVDTNLANQMVDANSHYKIYQNILKLRQNQAFKSNIIKVEALPNNVIKITRTDESAEDSNYIVLINMGGKKVSVKASGNDRELYEVIFTTDNSINEKDKIWEKDLTIDAYKAIALKVISKSDITYDWWKNAVIYQIYVRSFKDGVRIDGIGDLKGIIQKIDHLADLGVNVICLSSIYESVNKIDLGYDVSNFRKIDKDYGTSDDLKLLLVVAEHKGIKVIMDFVPNHSSKDHDWFKDPLIKSEYYLWKTVTPSDPLNNWLSVFQGRAWTKSSTNADEYYLHQFDSSQPDLNYKNPDVQNEMKNIMKYWLDEGVHGFRMTALPHLFETELFPNEPLSNDPEAKEDKWNSLRHVYTSDLPATFDLVYDWRNFLDTYTAEHGGNERIMIAETYTDIQNTMYYYGNKNKQGAHLTLNFQLIEKVDRTSNANDFAAKINEWIDHIPEGFTSNWVLGNHDKRRVATRFGPENVDGLNMLTAILPGVMVTYNGEEIGQEDTVLDVKNCDGDPVFCYKDGQTGSLEELRELRRDRQRTPFHWNGNIHAGFTTREKGPWLPVSSKYAENNLQKQTNQSNSHYELYKRLLKLRQNPAFVSGSVKVKAVTDYVLTSLRYHSENESYFHIFNLGNNVESFNLKTAYNESTPFLEVVETNDHNEFPAGTLLNAESITLQGHQSVIVIFTSKTMPGSATINVISSFVLVLSILINIVNFN